MKISNKLIKIAEILNSKQIQNVLVQATKKKCAVNIDYLTISGKGIKNYTVMPLQIKKRQLKYSNQLVLYAQDINENNRTKSFVIKNIKRIQLDQNKKRRIRKNLLEKFVKNH